MTELAPIPAHDETRQDRSAATGSAKAHDARPTLVGMTRERLRAFLRHLGVPERQLKMRTQQLWHWIYHRGARSFDEMTNIAKTLRADLAAAATRARPEVMERLVSVDGTRKWLLRLPPDETGQRYEVEMVYIPEPDRGTLCISSQVGCTLNCTFCHTGTQRWVRNLTPAEIVGQLMLARDDLGDWPAAIEAMDSPPPSGRFITNIVFMGMGEPLYNFDAVKDAVEVFADGEGISLSKRRITLSTAGVVPMIPRAGAEMGVMLAISLHATTDEVRDRLVPINRKYPIGELLQACRNYPGLSNAKRITFEYVMLKDINDSPADAKRLVNLLKGIPAKVNLIPFNPWPGSPYECSDWETIERFAEVINRAGYASPIRTPRGRDIMAACGQLKSESERLRTRARKAAEAAARAGGAGC